MAATELQTPQLPTVPDLPKPGDWKGISTSFTSNTTWLRSLMVYLQNYLAQMRLRIINASTVGVIANRPMAPLPGTFYFGSDDNHLYFFTGSAWITVH